MSQINITVKEFIDAYPSVIGYDYTSQCAYDLINRARIIAYPIGDWVGTMAYRPVYLVKQCYFILPYDLDIIREAKCLNGRSLNLDSIISKDEFCCGDPVLTRIGGRTYLPFQLTAVNPLCFYAINRKDKGSPVRVVYIDWSGTMHDEEVTLGHTKHEATRLTNIPKTIMRIAKGSTHGNVTVTNSVDTAFLAHNDKTPTFTVYEVGDICKSECIAIYAKKKYIPYTLDDESAVLDINPEALSSLIIAIKAKDARSDNWVAEYGSAVSLAKNFLNAELTNEQSTLVGITAVNFHSQLTEDLRQD